MCIRDRPSSDLVKNLYKLDNLKFQPLVWGLGQNFKCLVPSPILSYFKTKDIFKYGGPNYTLCHAQLLIWSLDPNRAQSIVQRHCSGKDQCSMSQIIWKDDWRHWFWSYNVTSFQKFANNSIYFSTECCKVISSSRFNEISNLRKQGIAPSYAL